MCVCILISLLGANEKFPVWECCASFLTLCASLDLWCRNCFHLWIRLLCRTDSLQNLEVLLPGHLITIYLKEKLVEWLRRTKKRIEDEINKNKDFEFGNVAKVKKLMDKNPAKQISFC